MAGTRSTAAAAGRGRGDRDVGGGWRGGPRGASVGGGPGDPPTWSPARLLVCPRSGGGRAVGGGSELRNGGRAGPRSRCGGAGWGGCGETAGLRPKLR